MRRGFTLIEMVVTVSIFVLVTSVLLANYPAFSNRVSLDLLVHDMALTVRKAQVYALSVRKFSDGSFPPYGVSFNSSTNHSFVIFADVVNGDGVYNAMTGCDASECVEQYQLAGGPVIETLCVNTGGVPYASLTQAQVVNQCGKTQLDIVFKRPNPDALFQVSPPDPSPIADASIILQSPRGDRRMIVIRSTGQISVQ